MPGLQFIKILGNLKFYSHGLKLGTEWDSKYSIKDEAEQANKGDKVAVPSVIPPWFMPAENPNKFHQESCDKIGKEFKDLKVNAVVALGTPGCLDGPELESNIKNAPMCASWSGNKAKHRDAVAKGVSKCYKDWQDKVMVPGLPWFPSHAAFPGPMAAPVPNIPMPLIVCPSAKCTDIMMPSAMAKAMDDALDGGLKDKDKTKQYEALHDAIATVLSLAFVMWMPMQQVMLVMGKGPIPTFAPPVVPVGPVVMGDNLGIPGHLMA